MPLIAGLNSTAMIGMSFQICSLIVAVAPALYDKLLQPLPASVVTYTLVSGLAASRFGLWTFDLTVTQRLQSDVTPSELGMQHYAPQMHLPRPSLSILLHYLSVHVSQKLASIASGKQIQGTDEQRTSNNGIIGHSMLDVMQMQREQRS